MHALNWVQNKLITSIKSAYEAGGPLGRSLKLFCGWVFFCCWYHSNIYHWFGNYFCSWKKKTTFFKKQAGWPSIDKQLCTVKRLQQWLQTVSLRRSSYWFEIWFCRWKMKSCLLRASLKKIQFFICCECCWSWWIWTHLAANQNILFQRQTIVLLEPWMARSWSLTNLESFICYRKVIGLKFFCGLWLFSNSGQTEVSSFFSIVGWKFELFFLWWAENSWTSEYNSYITQLIFSCSFFSALFLQRGLNKFKLSIILVSFLYVWIYQLLGWVTKGIFYIEKISAWMSAYMKTIKYIISHFPNFSTYTMY